MKSMQAMASAGAPAGPDEAALRRLAGMDLNLLVVFAALMKDRSVTAAAERLFVGQPAVSASLKRLRALLGDPLFVKAGRGMVATERALSLQLALQAALAQIDAAVFQPARFNPAQACMTLRLGLSDDNEIVFLPAIVKALARQAPQVRLLASPVSHADIGLQLDSGGIDIGMSVFGELPQWHRSEVLFEQGYGCLFDPAVGARGPVLDMHTFIASRQLIVTFDGTLHGKVDRVLAGMQLQRDVRLGTTRFSSLPHLVQGTALVASLPEMAGRVLARSHLLAFCPLPFAVPPGHPRMAWHSRHDADPASQWFRQLIGGCVRQVVADIRGPLASAAPTASA